MKRSKVWISLSCIMLIGIVLIIVLECGIWKSNKNSRDTAEIAADFVKKKGYAIEVNSGFEYKIVLPKNLSQFERHSKIKRLIKVFELEAYKRKTLTIFGYCVEKDGKDAGTYILCIDGSKIIGSFLDETENEEYVTLLRTTFGINQ
ncbi:DUF4830 domain-containing protein [Caldicellulosiruptor sp. F32]|uniref:DUF4830 domain-containing protein n=1 Tax=Caldicellulosiruptor sp. F32 TaxID=1214564 RepID=UPI00039E4891|nr:DUF4830 domain-containing protein [Caldicellulosiruptor sp. F32]